MVDLQQKLTIALRDVERLRVALLKLKNEVRGLSIAEFEIRQAIGNTNWNILAMRADEAEESLAATDRNQQKEAADDPR